VEYRRLGRTKLKVSAVGMGTWRSFDVRKKEEVARVCSLFERAVALGVNIFDTAPMYGAAEEVLGLARQRVRKEGLVVATKVLAHGREGARRQIEDSFRRLRTDRVDLMQVHNMAGWEVVAPLLEEYRGSGLIRHLGITDYRESMYPEMMRAMRTGLFDTIQIPYNPAQRRAERDILPLACELDLGVLVMTPISPVSNRDSLLRALGRADLSFLEAYGVRTPGQALLKYALGHPAVSAVIPATSRPERVSENAAAAEGPPLSGEDRRRLEEACGV
jgi:aryl-alcohol dehydrogenase-like predicted oxidoreductase